MDQFIRSPQAGKEDKQLKFTVAIFTGFLLGVTALASVGQAGNQQNAETNQTQLAQRS